MDHQLWLLLQLRDESFQWIVYVPGEGDNIYEVYDCNQPTEFLLEDEQCGGACQIYPDCFEFRIVSLRSRLIIEIPYTQNGTEPRFCSFTQQVVYPKTSTRSFLIISIKAALK